MIIHYYLIIILLGFYQTSLNGEVQSVTMKWTPGRCEEGCQEKLSKAFDEASEVNDITINYLSGSASLTWNPKEKLSYRVLKRPMQRVGLGIDSISVIVRGRINRVGNHIVLTSEGDGTTFRLVSYDDRKPGARYLSLDPQIEKQMMQNRENNEIYIVDGPLYQPHRSPPFYLVVRKVQIEKP